MKNLKTRKWTAILLCLAMALGLCASAGAEPVKASLPVAKATVLEFTSGVGAWMSEITLNPDGTVTGYYHDSDMGDDGEGYPNGTLYESSFSGYASEVTEMGPQHWRVKLVLTTEKEPGTEAIVDGVRHIYTEPAGLSGGECDLLLPGADLGLLSEEALSWWIDAPEHLTVLTVPALVNVLDGCTYYGFPA